MDGAVGAELPLGGIPRITSYNVCYTKLLRILVVDDEIYIVHILDFSLGMEGYEVITALDGEQALEKAGGSVEVTVAKQAEQAE